MKNITTHDAIKLIKYQSFFKNLKYYEVTFRVFSITDSLKPGMYYIIIKDQEQFIDMAFEVDVLKKTFWEVDIENTLEEIKEKNLIEFKVDIIRKKDINDELR